MQRLYSYSPILEVVFTFQKEGRCNWEITSGLVLSLFLPFKKKADAILVSIQRLMRLLFLTAKSADSL